MQKVQNPVQTCSLDTDYNSDLALKSTDDITTNVPSLMKIQLEIWDISCQNPVIL